MSGIKLPKLTKVTSKNENKPTILLLGDDLRMHSGIATMSREFVYGTLDRFNWVQLGAGLNHPDHGKVFDMSSDAQKTTGVEDAYLKLYAHNGYGNAKVLQEILNIENPVAIIHFTDPRFWIWLYQIEHEIRQQIPILYYNIWDDLPYPHWNKPYYESCDSLICISRQTENIVKNIIDMDLREPWQVSWVPHGVNHNVFRKLNENDRDWDEYQKFIEQFKLNNDPEFIVFWNNRNIRRKNPADVILAFKYFCDTLPAEKAKKCYLLMHTAPNDSNGTDLFAVKNTLCPNYNVIFSNSQVDSKIMNFYYNMADVTVNIASNEGFGISWLESLMSETPIINNVTGGLQDGCRFEDENGDWIKFTTDFSSNHTGKYKNHGKWAFPVFPASRSVQGSPQTPYIFDDRANYEDVGQAIKLVYELPSEVRKTIGKAGRDWAMSSEANMSAEAMSNGIADAINTCLQNWKPKQPYTMTKVTAINENKPTGVLNYE